MGMEWAAFHNSELGARFFLQIASNNNFRSQELVSFHFNFHFHRISANARLGQLARTSHTGCTVHTVTNGVR